MTLAATVVAVVARIVDCAIFADQIETTGLAVLHAAHLHAQALDLQLQFVDHAAQEGPITVCCDMQHKPAVQRQMSAYPTWELL